MKTSGLCLAFGVSVLPLALESVAPRLALESTRAALVLLPWVALATLPARPRSPLEHGPRAAGRAVLEVGAFALLPLALALGLDRAEGTLAWGNALIAFALLVLWTLARELAAAGGRARRFYALLWLALVPGLAALSVASWAGGASESSARVLGGLGQASPLGWIYRSGRDGMSPASGALAALGLGLFVLALSALSSTREIDEIERSTA